MSATIYVLTHKPFSFPPDPAYVPLQVGSALHEHLPYLHDDTGDNISAKNLYYSELTGIYWIWKNDAASDIIGTAHYRRYLLNGDHIFTAEEAARELQECDLISTKQVALPTSYYEAFSADHHQKDLDVLADIIRELRPAYSETFNRVVHGNRTYFGNMFIMPRSRFMDYCDFLFPLLIETEKQVDMTGYTAYQKRLYGFLSELLLTVYVQKNALRVKECMVGMSGEKKETKETEDAVAACFARGDKEGARKCILDALEKRPDLLMEASDIYGHLKTAMQVIATCDAEENAGMPTMLDRDRNYHTLIARVQQLNAFVRAKAASDHDSANTGKQPAHGGQASCENYGVFAPGDSYYSDEEFKAFRKAEHISEPAVRIAEIVFGKSRQEG